MQMENIELFTSYDLNQLSTIAFHTKCRDEYNIQLINFILNKGMEDTDMMNMIENHLDNAPIEFQQYYSLILIHNDIIDYLKCFEKTGGNADYTEYIETCQQRVNRNERFYSQELRNAVRNWIVIHGGAANI